MAGQGLVKSPYTIDKNSNGSTWVTADFATAASWTEVLSYAVPLGMAIEITPVNYHFGDFNTTDTTTAITAGQTRILKQNANGTESREIWSGSNGIFKDIGDEFQRPKIRVPVVVNASQKIVVQVYSMGTTFDSASSNYYIECIQYYEEI
jgi:hypothetical protein